jgi:mannose-6-phosphate isomerase-like protein (cupin superfamily)
MFSFLRPSLPPKTNTVTSNHITYEDGASSVKFYKAGSDYILENVHQPFNKDRPSIMTPPPHYHVHQAEHFRIVSGSVDIFRESIKTPWMTLSADNSDALKTASIPKRVVHTIKNASAADKLVLDVSLTPEDYEAEQKFFRNFFGYLDYCRMAGSPPSIFQLRVFLNSANTPIALPLPGMVAFIASRVFLFVMSWWGKWATRPRIQSITPKSNAPDINRS